MFDTDSPRTRTALKDQFHPRTAPAVDRWVEEQMFEEDLRAVLLMVRPHGRERLMGWEEYRTGGRHFRATVSWDAEFAEAGSDPDPHAHDECFAVPNMVDVLESILLGSIRADCDLSPDQQHDAYRAVARELTRRVERHARCEF